MAIMTYPLNGILYDAEDVETYLCTRTSGVFSSDGHFPASVTGSREVTIGPGLAWMQNEEFHGKAVYNPENAPLEIAEADPYQTRIDRIILRYDKLINTTQLLVLEGTPASNPKAPNIERDSLTYDLGLYTVNVRPSVISLSESDISSTILDESVCGIMEDAVTSIPTQELYDQWYAWFHDLQADTDAFEEQFRQWFEDIKQEAEDDLRQNQITFNTWLSETKEEFDAWFANLKNILDGDVAGHLQIEIEAAQETADNAYDKADVALTQLAGGFVDGYMLDVDDVYGTNVLLADDSVTDEVILLTRNICCCEGEHGSPVDYYEIQSAVDEYLTNNPVQPTPVDSSLTIYGQAADAKIVGDKLELINHDIDSINNDITDLKSTFGELKFKTLDLEDFTTPALTDVALTDHSYTDVYDYDHKTDSLYDVLKEAWDTLEDQTLYLATLIRETQVMAFIQKSDNNNGSALVYGFAFAPQYWAMQDGTWKDAVSL